MSTKKCKQELSHTAHNYWDIFEYEIKMYFRTREILGRTERNTMPGVIGNALTESALLHTRVLVDILLDRRMDDDIALSDLLPNWQSSENLAVTLTKLRDAYGNKNIINSPYWTLNKMLAHPSSLRTSNHNYTDLLHTIDPIIVSAVNEIASLSNRSQLIDYQLCRDDSLNLQSLTAYTHTTTTSISFPIIDDVS